MPADPADTAFIIITDFSAYFTLCFSRLFFRYPDCIPDDSVPDAVSVTLSLSALKFFIFFFIFSLTLPGTEAKIDTKNRIFSVGEVTTGIGTFPKTAAARLWRHNALVSRKRREGAS